MLQTTKFSQSQLDQVYRGHMARGLFREHRAQIDADLRDMGAVAYDMWLPETHILPLIIHPDERIKGIVYGRYREGEEGFVGRGALVATDRRVILVDKKPSFVRCDEVGYGVVNGITYGRVGLMGTVVLHTRIGNVSLRTFNQDCAHSFVEAIEANIFDNKRDAYYDYTT